MKQFFYLLLFVPLLVMLSCNRPEPEVDISTRVAPPVGPNTSTTLALVETPQDAVFYIGWHWVGGPGSAPVLVDQLTYAPMRYNDKPIFFDESFVSKIAENQKLSVCYRGRPTIKVAANITLTQKTGPAGPLPPERDGRQPTYPKVSYYEATVNKLYGTYVEAETCAQ